MSTTARMIRLTSLTATEAMEKFPIEKVCLVGRDMLLLVCVRLLTLLQDIAQYIKKEVLYIS